MVERNLVPDSSRNHSSLIYQMKISKSFLYQIDIRITHSLYCQNLIINKFNIIICVNQHSVLNFIVQIWKWFRRPWLLYKSFNFHELEIFNRKKVDQSLPHVKWTNCSWAVNKSSKDTMQMRKCYKFDVVPHLE